LGQYHVIADLDKQEVLHPHRFGEGLKMLEFGCDQGGVLTALTLLLACSHDRSGGDYHPESEEEREWLGRWAGDRIAIVGDYSEDADLPAEFEAGTLYQRIADEYRDISGELRPLVQRAMG